MKRVASLYLPNWSIDRLRRAERHHASPERPIENSRDSEFQGGASDAVIALKRAGDAEQGGKQCDAPKNTGWRPGARWARAEAAAGDGACWAGETRADVERRIAALPSHQRPPMREMGRRSEAAASPYKRLPGDDGGKSGGWSEPAMVPVRTAGEGVRANAVQRHAPAAAIAAWNVMPAIRYPGDGPHPDKRRRSNDAGAHVPPVAPFFDTGRSTAGTVARACPEAYPPVSVPAAGRGPRSARVERSRDTATHRSAAGEERAPPLVTVHKIGSRVEVAAACPEARALGIAPGMALTQVRAANPGIAVRDADPAGDHADLHRLAIALARRWSPVVAISDADGLFLDLTGVAHLHGGEARMAGRIVRLLARLGIAARVAVADTAGAAWALARYGGVAVAVLPPTHTLVPLATLPTAALRIDGAALDLLHRLGIDRVGDLAAMPRGPLVRRFGREVTLRLDQASGHAPEPLDPVEPPVPIMVEQRFAEPLLTAEPIAHWLGLLAARLAEALARAGHGARLLVLAATRVDAAVCSARIGFARPTRDAAHMLRLLVRRIETIDPGFGIEALALHVVRADPLGPAALAADLAENAAPDLAPLVDALVNRIGTRRLWRSCPHESDVPERAVGAAAPVDPPARAAARLRLDDVRRLDLRDSDHPWHPRWPRPVRLLHRPEPVDLVLAELPDQHPRRFRWRGRTHRVVRGDGPERITGEWWRRAAERESVRDYFQVEDDSGERFWLFRRGDAEHAASGDLAWYIHGTFA